MGLDMYLMVDKYPISNELKDMILKEFEGYGNSYIKLAVEVGYWRKANQIHRWFVENVQDGEDDCGDYYVSREYLEKLLSTCKEVSQDHSLSEKLLPSQSGFFFGDTGYDEYYFRQIENTIEILERVLKMENVSFYYHSSW